MSGATRRPSVGRAKGQELRRGAGRQLDRAAQAQRGAELEFVRTAGPRAIAQMLARLEASGEIVANNDVSADAQDFDLDEATDVELNLEDEDLAPVEIWQKPASYNNDAVVLGDEAESQEPWAEEDKHELIVRNGICTFQNPEWAWTYDPVTQSAREQLNEIAASCRVFRALADWLTTARPSFLKSRQFWDLGPTNLEEAEQRCSALQKHLLPMLDIGQSIREETFSRFIRQAVLAWSDGSAPVQVLFSKHARLAWVAQAVVLFQKKYPKVPLKERLHRYRYTKATTTFEEFLQQVNEKAVTSWKEVLKQYETRMLSEDNHGKKD